MCQELKKSISISIKKLLKINKFVAVTSLIEIIEVKISTLLYTIYWHHVDYS